MDIKIIRFSLIKPLVFLVVILLLSLPVCSRVNAQANLAKTVSISNTGKMQLGTLLAKIAGNLQFNFAYNNRDVPADSSIVVTAYNGRLESFLSQLLGANYEFREVPGYIIIRYARGRLSLEMEKSIDQDNFLLVDGRVNDAHTGEAISNASIYAKYQLASTLTDEQGNFQLKIKKNDGALMLTASKENYRDTSLYLLKDVPVVVTVAERRYKYDPKLNSKTRAKHSGFSRLFITSRQNIQNLNLGGLFQYSPYQVSLTPGLSSRGLYNSQIINRFSLNVIGGYTAGIQGVELAGAFNIDRSDVSFLQAACAFNLVGGNMKGVQLAGLYNRVLNNASGVQLSGLINFSSNFSSGIQMAGLVNVSDSCADVQASILVNKAKKVKGLQFGLINVADSSDYVIGVVNLIKNGEKSIALSSDETPFIHLDFRSGGKILYGLAGVGYNLNNPPFRYTLDLGIGAHFIQSKHFGLDVEYVNEAFYGGSKTNYTTNAIKLLPHYKFDRHFQLFAGPGLSFVSTAADNHAYTPGWVINRHVSNNNLTAFSSAITYGLLYNW